MKSQLNQQNSDRGASASRRRRDGCWPALLRLEDVLERNNFGSNAEAIRRMRAAYFADVDEDERVNPLVLPD